jgi:hypothetical protein
MSVSCSTSMAKRSNSNVKRERGKRLSRLGLAA